MVPQIYSRSRSPCEGVTLGTNLIKILLLTQVPPCEGVDCSAGVLVDERLRRRSKCSHPADTDHTVVDHIDGHHVSYAVNVDLHHTKEAFTRL